MTCEGRTRPRLAGAESASNREIPVHFVSLHLSNRWSRTRTNDMNLETSNDVRVLGMVIRGDGNVVRLHLLVAAQGATGPSDMISETGHGVPGRESPAALVNYEVRFCSIASKLSDSI